MSEPVGTDNGSRRPVATGALITALSQVVSALAGGVTMIVIARLLGPAGVGVYAVVVATVAILTVVSALGLDSGALYYASGRRWRPGEAARQLQVAALVLGLVGCATGIVMHAATSGPFADIDAVTFWIGLAAIPFSLSWLFGSALALSQERYERAALAPVSQAALGLALTLALSLEYGVRGALFAFTASHAATATWVVAIGLHRTEAVARDWLRSMPAKLWTACRFGAKLSVAAVLGTFNRRADLLILSAYGSHAMVGWYSVALSVTELQILLPASLSRVVVPRVSSLDAENAEDERTFVVAKSVRHGVVVSVVGAAAMAFALLLVPLVFGHAFEPSVELGWILVPGVAAYGLANVLAGAIVGSGRPAYLLRAAAIVTPATLVLYLVLIPAFEATGAAVASTISYSCTLVLVWFYFRRVSSVYHVRALLPGREEIADYRHLGRLVGVRVRGR